MRILIAEDEDFSRHMLQAQLEQFGHEVVAVADGLDAWETLRSEDISLLITDWVMPGLDGLELVRRIRGEQTRGYVYVILLTSKSEKRDLVQGILEGADDFLTKPCDLDELRVRVRAGQRILDLEARLVTRNEELALTKDQLERASQRMKRDLEAAAKVQKALLPTTAPEHELLDVAWIFQPCDELAGDMFNVFRLDQDCVGFYLLDVAGHGVSAALLSVTLSRLLSPALGASSILFVPGSNGQRLATPSELARELNERFAMRGNDDRFFTLFFGTLNLNTWELCYVIAGHPSPVYAPVDGPPCVLEGSGFAIGAFEEADFEHRCLRLRPGDRVFVYSDGLADATNPRGERFGEDRVLQFAHARHDSLSQSISILKDAVSRWCGESSRLDDISVLAVSLAGSAHAEAT